MPLGELDEDSSSPEAAFPRFHPESQSSSPEAAYPRFHPESRSSYNSDMAQNVSKPVSVFKTTQLAQGHIRCYNTQLELWTIIASYHPNRNIITVRKCHHFYDSATDTQNNSVRN